MARQLPPGPRQLPAGACIRHAITSVRNNIVYAFRISWPWYVVLTLVGLAAGFIADYVTGGNVEAYPGRVLPLYMLIGFVNLLGFASIAVNWHRYILLDEVPRGSELFRLDDKTWRYFGNVLLMVLALTAAGSVIVVPFAILAGLAESPSMLIVAFLIILPVMMILFYRLGMKLPAIALGRRDFLMRDSWAVTRDNKLSILLVALFQFLIGLAIFLILALLVFGLTSMNAMLGVIIGTAIQLIVGWVLSIFGITILTSLYGFFVESRDF